MAKLKPYPFCGGKPELRVRKLNSKNRPKPLAYRYVCSNDECHAGVGRWSGGISGHPWTAAEVWNTRR